MILVLPLIISSVCLIYYLLKDRWETELIMYYTIDHSSYVYYKITLWKSEVYIYRNKFKKSIIVEQTESLYKHNIDEVELMQYTGLKDIHGKEIYEGDVVRYECCFESYVEEVIYDDKHCNFGTIDKDEKTFSFDALISDFDVDCFEVVGNKYENLELLGDN